MGNGVTVGGCGVGVSVGDTVGTGDGVHVMVAVGGTGVNVAVGAGGGVAVGVQWGIGLLIDVLQTLGHSMATAHRYTFLALLATQVIAYAWFCLSSHRAR